MLRTLLVLSCCCLSFFTIAQTQMELNATARQAFLKADKELNQVYRRVLKAYKNDTVLIRNLSIAQKTWIRFRDAEMAAVFPDRSGPHGSIEPMCYSLELAELTKQRTKRLREWLSGVEVGELCGGSRVRE